MNHGEKFMKMEGEELLLLEEDVDLEVIPVVVQELVKLELVLGLQVRGRSCVGARVLPLTAAHVSCC